MPYWNENLINSWEYILSQFYHSTEQNLKSFPAHEPFLQHNMEKEILTLEAPLPKAELPGFSYGRRLLIGKNCHWACVRSLVELGDPPWLCPAISREAWDLGFPWKQCHTTTASHVPAHPQEFYWLPGLTRGRLLRTWFESPHYLKENIHSE